LKAFFCKRPCPNAAALLREFDNLIHLFHELAGLAVVTHPLRLSSILIFLLSFLAQGCLSVRREARMIFCGKFLAFGR
jgi:hypothetical protein